jgi:hypothetical protein
MGRGFASSRVMDCQAVRHNPAGRPAMVGWNFAVRSRRASRKRTFLITLDSAEFSATFWRFVTCTHSRRATVR